MAKNRLFWISFLVLFVEMASIRWLNASVTILAYFNNPILISCFFGLGVGCLLAPRKIFLIHHLERQHGGVCFNFAGYLDNEPVGGE